MRQPVVARLLELVRLRNTHPAFAGGFSLPDVPDGELALAWRNGDATAELQVALAGGSWRVSVDGAVVADGYAAHLKKPS